MSGIFKSLPFAIWFFLAIEEVPLAAEESMDPRRDVPKGSVWAMHTLLIAAILTLVFNTALPGGAHLYAQSGFPLLDGLYAIFGKGNATELLGLLFVIGLVASFFTIIFAYGRNTYSLSRAGYFPKFLSKTHGERKTPHVALIAGAVVGYAVAYIVYLLQQKELGTQIVAALLNMAVFAAVISYIMQMTSFVMLAAESAEHRAPVPEPLGYPGRRGLGDPRGDRARVDLPERCLSTRCVRGRHLLRPRGPVLRHRRTAPAGALAGRGVRAHPGRARRARAGGLLDLEGGARGHPGRWLRRSIAAGGTTRNPTRRLRERSYA